MLPENARTNGENIILLWARGQTLSENHKQSHGGLGPHPGGWSDDVCVITQPRLRHELAWILSVSWAEWRDMMTNTGGWIGWRAGAAQSGWIDSMTSQTWCVLICFIRQTLENRYRPGVSLWGRETQQIIESADTPPYPVLPYIIWGRILTLHLKYGAGYLSPPLPRSTDLQLLSWQPGACTLETLSWSRCIFWQIITSTRLIHICSC